MLAFVASTFLSRFVQLSTLALDGKAGTRLARRAGISSSFSVI
jgi:hypothetical protein